MPASIHGRLRSVNLEALWHDLECGDYREDLPYWRALAAETGGPVLDIGAGTGRVTVDLAAAGVDGGRAGHRARAARRVSSHRAAVETVVADACTFELDRRFGLIVAPMQTLQLLERPDRLPAPRARAPATRRPARRGDLRRDGLLRRRARTPAAAAGDRHRRYPLRLAAARRRRGRRSRRDPPPPPDHRPGRRARRRPPGPRLAGPDHGRGGARWASSPNRHRHIPETDRYLGSTIVVLRAPT